MTCFSNSIIAQYIKDKNISIDEISKCTNISKNILKRSLCDLSRPLRANEFLDICAYIQLDTQDIYAWCESERVNK